MNSEIDSGQSQISRSKAWEETWPYCLGLVVGVVYGTYGRRIPLSPNLKDGFIAVAGLAGLFAAFFLTSASILVSLKDSWLKRRTIESGAYFSLVGYLLTAMGWSLATAIVTIGAIFLDGAARLWWYHYALTAWACLLSVTLGVSIRVLRIFSVLMKYIARF
jgi:hypothetical protein